ncbi:MAG: TetR/AcrR family transcriptional regulator [Actinomycetota bacterium]|nr:TetR/AcrR family transcriptional regulator [Actinomycetota bacterium]
MPTAVADEAARELVLGAADRLYNARGIQSVGMDTLQAESGVSLKRLYKLFPSKENIVEQVLRRRHDRWVEGLAEAASSADSPRDRLLAIFDFLGRWFDESDFRGCAFINSFGEMGGTTESLAAIVRSHKADFQAYVAALVEAAGAPASLAPQLALLAEGAQTTAAISGDTNAAADARRAAETLIAVAMSHA